MAQTSCPYCRQDIYFEYPYPSKCPYCLSALEEPDAIEGIFKSIGSLIILALIYPLYLGITWLWRLFTDFFKWFWEIFTWPFRMIWAGIVWVWNVLGDVFSFLSFIVNYLPSVLAKFMGFSYEPTWWKTILVLGVYILILSILDAIVTSSKK
jgi:hypothetical protein